MPDQDGQHQPKRRITHGRRSGHRLSPRQRRALQSCLPDISVRPAGQGTLDPLVLFREPVDEVWLEIGFGGGEHLIWQAERNPSVGILGAEPFINGVAKLVVRIDELSIRNVRVHPGDARDLLDALKPATLDRLFVLFPDPWPKTRHHKRRIVNPATAKDFARVLRSGGEVVLASDIAGYQRWMLDHMLANPDFQWTARRAPDWRTHPDGAPMTRYHSKAVREGRRAAFLTFRRT